MASIIDSREQINTLDRSNVLGSIQALPDQLSHAWELAQAIQAKPLTGIKNIVVSGMGGSALGAHVIRTLYKEELNVPLEVVNHYQLPRYVNGDTLVILSSYSGTTEETLASGKDAVERGAQLAVITAGGSLKDFALKNQCPIFLIDPKFNPSNQPRMAIGYSVFGMLSLFNALGILKLTEPDITQVKSFIQTKSKELGPEIPTENNLAKHLAFSAVDRLIYLVSAEHISGAAHVFNNQLNENSKQLTVELQIPELNHHYMEGLTHPKHMQGQTVFWYFNSQIYHPRVQNRMVLTQIVTQKAGHDGQTVLLTGTTKLSQAFELIQLGAYTNFYLAMLNGIDPAPIPTVDYFKSELTKL